MKLTDRFMPMKEARQAIGFRKDDAAILWLIRYDVCIYKMGARGFFVIKSDLDRALQTAEKRTALKLAA